MTDTVGEDLPLAAEFPAATREQWTALVAQVLKGAPFDRKLVARSYDGLAIQPLYPRATHARPVARHAAGAPWQVLQRIEHPDPVVANVEARHEIENGATGLTLVFAQAIGAHGYGMAPTEAALARMLEGVHLNAGVALELDLGPHAEATARSLASLMKSRDLCPTIRFGIDPLGMMAASGSSPASWRDLAPPFAAIVADLATQGFRGPIAAADGRLVHAAGGSEAQELAFALATAVAYLRALEAASMPLDTARRMIFFRLAADADQFLTIAKFRALRKVWARVEDACGLAPEPAFVSAETAWRMMSRRDAHVNMLRATVAAFAAGLGGADAIALLPFTAALGLPDRSARRAARNTQLVLLEESNLARVADPAAGSGAMEDLTEQLGRAAWTLFQEIERAGGVAAALEQGLIQDKVARVRATREQAVARRKDALTGTSEFPDLAEMPVSTLDMSPALRVSHGAGVSSLPPLPQIRLAEPFERLRDASDRMIEETGARPKVFLANLGKPADFTARAMFARNFFAAGGIEAVANDGRDDSQAMAGAFRASRARLACLCSSDAVYARQGEQAAKDLAASGARHIYLAGRPVAGEAELKQAGVGTLIYAGCDALATLAVAHDMLRITATDEAKGE